MVKPKLPPQVRVEIDAAEDDGVTYRHTWRAQNILNSAVITWGRDSLFQAPRNRSLAVTLINIQRERNGKWFLYRKISVYVENLLVFQGTIDHVRMRHHTNVSGQHVILVDVDAVEGGLFNRQLMVTREIRPLYVRDFVDDFHRESQGLDIEVKTFPNRKDGPVLAWGKDPVKFTMKRAFELAAAWHPLAQPEWMPNHKEVHPTIHKLWDDLPPTDNIPASNVDIADAEATIEKTPQAWEITTGGEYQDKVSWITTYNRAYSVTAIPLHEINVPVRWSDFQGRNEKYAQDAFKLLKGQAIDPQRMTVIDGGKQVLNTTAHLRTWETPERGIKITGQMSKRWVDPRNGKIDALRQLNLVHDGWWYPIGGRLSLSSELISHTWNVIKAGLN